MMSNEDMTVQELLQRYPAAVKAFIQYNTQCIGCAFERFCTLEDVARQYHIPLPELQLTIDQLIHNSER
jgi:hybrid cluster-associated redox disulfide protein